MLYSSCWIVIASNMTVKLTFHMYVTPIHGDLVHVLGAWGAPVLHSHVDQHMSTWHLHVFSQHCHVVLKTYKPYTKFHQACQATQMHGNFMMACSCRFITVMLRYLEMNVPSCLPACLPASPPARPPAVD